MWHDANAWSQRRDYSPDLCTKIPSRVFRFLSQPSANFTKLTSLAQDANPVANARPWYLAADLPDPSPGWPFAKRVAAVREHPPQLTLLRPRFKTIQKTRSTKFLTGLCAGSRNGLSTHHLRTALEIAKTDARFLP